MLGHDVTTVRDKDPLVWAPTGRWSPRGDRWWRVWSCILNTLRGDRVAQSGGFPSRA